MQGTTMRNAGAAVLVFCKPPVAGHVKTRLIGTLTAREAAEVHRACLLDTVALVDRVPKARKWLYVAADRRTAQRLAARIRLRADWNVVTQRGKDLGERMQSAIAEQLRGGASKVVIVGTDSPWMGTERMAEALRALERAEVVLGPSADGGYYLVGAGQVVPKMFSGIRWGTAEVFGKTLRALRGTRTTFRVLQRDFDLDRPEDLKRAERIARRGKWMASALKEWMRRKRKNRLEADATGSSRRRGRVRLNKRRRPGRA